MRTGGGHATRGDGDANTLFASPTSFAHPLACFVARRVGRVLIAGAGERKGGVLSLLPTSPDTRRRVVHVLFVFVFICSISSL